MLTSKEMIRQPAVQGAFYPADANQLLNTVKYFLQRATVTEDSAQPWGVMLPHAGYVYCGSVIGATLKNVTFPEIVLLLCPNHTGQGQPFGVWPEGQWLLPFGAVPVHKELAARLIAKGIFVADRFSHLREHSIEVLLPFLPFVCKGKIPAIVPVCIGTQRPDALAQAGAILAEVLTEFETAGTKIGLVVSSDMNHYEDEQTTLRKDNVALEKILHGDPIGLLQSVASLHITMCGAGPMALALFAARKLGQITTKVIGHDTSATASGDKQRVVGYAGVRMFLQR